MKTRYIAGDNNVICDITGQKFKRSECRIGEPGSIISGLLVHHSVWSPRQPQLDIRTRRDDQAVRNSRPRQPLRFAEGQGPNDQKISF